MSIDIDDLSYDELLDLNDRIIARLKHLDAADALNAMMKLTLGSKVCFDSDKHGMQVGTSYCQIWCSGPESSGDLV